MTVLSDLIARLTLDSSDYDAGLKGAESKTKSSMGAIGKQMGDMGRKMQQTGAVMTAAITLPIIAVGMRAVDMASDLEESRSKVQVVFGDMAGIVEEFADSAAVSMGMSSQEALAAAGTYGNLFRSMEIGLETSTDMSIGLVQMAADLASFNNIDPTLALDKLRAGLTGETEPLKSLGINLNQAMIKAKAMELGLISAGGELTAAAKAQASYALILEQTTLAQGDFARTSDGMANSSRIMKAQLADLTAELGTQLLPIALSVVKGISGLIQKFSDLPGPVKKGILIFLGVVAALGPIISIVGTVMTAVSGLMGAWGAVSGAVAGAGAAFTAAIPVIGAVIAPLLPVIAIVLAIGAAIALVALAWKNNWGDIQGKTAEAIEWLKGAWERFKQWIVDTGDRIVAGIKGAFDIDWGQIGRNIIDGISNAIRNGIQSVVNAALDLARSVFDAVKDFLGIDSRSKRFVWVGKMSVEGLAGGLQKTAPIEQAMTSINQIVGVDGSQMVAAIAGIGPAIRPQPTAAPEAPGGRELKVTQHIYNQVDAEKTLGDILDLLDSRD